MFTRFYVEAKPENNKEMNALLESKYAFLNREIDNQNRAYAWTFLVNRFRKKKFIHDVKNAVEMGYIVKWFEA